MLRAAARSARRCAQIVTRNTSGVGYVAARKVCSQVKASTMMEGASSVHWMFGLAALGAASMAPCAFASEKEERSFIMVKPDGVHRGLVAEIIKRFESKGYKLVGIKVIVPSKDLASKHYEEHNGKPFYPKLVDFLSSGPCVAMVWEGRDVIAYGRTMIGATKPSASAPGTIRGDFAIEMGRNIIHGSDSIESAQQEISLWFSAKELADYSLCTTAWIYE